MKIITLVVLMLSNCASVYADIPGGTQPQSLGIFELVLFVLFIAVMTFGVIYLRDNK